MPLPASGAISMSQVATITKASGTATVTMNESTTRTLFGVPTGQISMSSGYSKPAANSTTYSTAGSYSYIVPVYQFLTANSRGGGGGGGGQCWFSVANGGNGGPGTGSTFASTTNVIGNGGPGGAGQSAFSSAPVGAQPGAGGSGGTVTTGGGGTAGPGGGNAGPGGAGGKSVQTWTFASTAGYPTWGSTITTTVGGGGGGGAGGGGVGAPGSAGGVGSVVLSGS